MQTYHRALSPWVAEIDLGVVRIVPTKHAWMQSCVRKFRFPDTVDTAGRVVESTYRRHSLVKVLVRVPYEGSQDLCLVLKPDGEGAMVCITAWLNHANDTHETLDTEKYAK